MEKSPRHDGYTTLDDLLESTSRIYIAPSPLLDHSPESRLSRVERIVQNNPESAGFQGYEYLVNNNNAVKAAFIAGTEGNPAMEHRRLTSEADKRDLLFLTLAAQNTLIVLMGSERTDRTEALFDAMEYRQSEMFMIHMAAKMNDETLTTAERIEAAEWFKLANEALYGVPENKIFSAVARERLQPHLDADFSNDAEAAELQHGLRERIGHINDEGYELQRVTAEAQECFNRLIHERFDELVSHIEPRYELGPDGQQIERMFTPAEVADAIHTTLEKMGALELGWRCEVIAGKELLAVSAHRKLVEVGENRAPMNAAELRSKIGHEVGVHVLRSVNAERAGWPSAAYGQQGYLDAEESFANKVGAVYADEAALAGPEYRYLIAGFAYGLDNHDPRDARDCYEIMWRAIALDTRKAGTPLDINKAKSDAYLQCNRMFRGTPFDIPGLTMNKDLSYKRGDEVVNPIINMIETQEDIELMVAGKLDPSRADHLPIAEDIVPNTRLGRKLRERLALAA